MPLPDSLVRTGPHDRFACRSCAACCRSYRIPLAPDEVARIEVGAWTFPWLEEVSPARARAEGAPPGGGVLRRRADGACVFLGEDNLCDVERRLGRAAKPDVCRMFPLAVVRAPDGALDATVVPECASWHESHEAGATLAESAEIPAPVPARLVVIAPPALPVRLGGPLLLWADVRALALSLGRRVAEAPTLEAALAGFGAEIAAAEVSKAKRVVSRALADPPPPARETSRDALLASLAVVLRDAAVVPGVEPEGRARALGLADAAEGLRGRPGWEGAFQGLSGPSTAFLRASLRTWIEGPTLAQARVEVEATLGLLTLCARLVVARAGAIESCVYPSPAALNAAAKECSLLLRDPSLPALLRAHAPALRALIRPTHGGAAETPSAAASVDPPDACEGRAPRAGSGVERPHMEW